ncbi:hypothetical protein DVR12_05515 [Chitinophaga silvatica]|uniref:Lipocalin-like domain-containing protein n=1 Tax=Chitinophaga silvatica TaxID=2282649 RepID=A0A3E1YDS2_9BACT|nr:lipocalin family protein [Chitinophaga silvatica]RFS24661.1 hypothetical protein DVR12_05515 [Chitinophaga silvatica]
MKTLLTLLTVIACLSACKKTDTTVDEINGSWKLNDLMQVNDSQGTPENTDLAALNYSTVAFNADGSFITSGNSQGRWIRQNENIILKLSNGQEVSMKVAEVSKQEMTLEQSYAPSGNKAGGSIYYQYVKK